MEFEIVPAKNGQAALRAIREDGSILTVNSIYDPGREAAIWAEDADLNAHSMVLFGLGLGYHARELLQRSPSLSHLFIVEPFAELSKLARDHNNMDGVLDDPRVHLVSDWHDFAARYREEVDRWKKIRLLKIPVYAALCQDRYEGFLEKFRRELNSLVVDRRTVISSALRWQENAFKNLSYLRESAPISAVFGSMKGKPAIIVSAGPSLDRNLPILKQAQNRAMIVAVGTVARLLHSNGIEPSVVMSFDGWETNYNHHFRDLELSSTPLVYDLAVHHRVVAEYRGPRVLMLVNPANYWLEEVMDCEIGRIEMGPSIANTAFDFCLQLGADPIIFVGQDLAYTDRRRHASFTHDPDADGYEYEVPEQWLSASKASDTVEIKAGSEKQANYWRRSRVIWVPANDGGQVATDDKLLTFLHWFEERIRSQKGSRIFINATEGGARIEGTLVLSLQEALNRYCPDDIGPQLQRIHQSLTATPSYPLDKLMVYLKKTRGSYRLLRKMCEKSVSICDRLLEHYQDGKEADLGKLGRDLKKVDRKLLRAQKYYKPIQYLNTPIAGLLSLVEGAEFEDPVSIIKHSRFLYDSFLQTFNIALPFIDGLVTELEGGNPVAPVISARVPTTDHGR